MARENQNIKVLKLKRDVCRLILDIHTFLQVKESKDSEHFKYVYKYVEFMSEFSGFEERLADIISRAQKYGYNPNTLEYDNELYHKVGKLLERGTEEEKSEIKAIEAEMNSILHICGNPKTLSGELIDLFNQMERNEYSCPIRMESLKNYISLLIKRYAKYKVGSIEYAFLMELDSTEEWYTSCFDSYFFDENIKPELMAYDYDYLISKSLSHTSEKGFAKLKRAIANYAKRNISMSEENLLYIISSANHQNMKYIVEIMRTLSQEPHICPFTAEQYLDSLFDDLINKKDGKYSDLLQDKAYADEPYCTDVISKTLIRLFIPLDNLSTEPRAFVSLLAQKVALLDDSLEISSRLCDFISKCTPDYSSDFINAYFQASDELNNSRSKLIMVLHQIKEKRL